LPGIVSEWVEKCFAMACLNPGTQNTIFLAVIQPDIGACLRLKNPYYCALQYIILHGKSEDNSST
jgi:hypothetical protein